MKKNQGFSLVELIVVIAIMAVLVGVLAPAYLRYVEKSRKSADVDAVSDVIDTATKIASDAQFEEKVESGFVFTLGFSSGKCTASTTDTAVTKEWQENANIGTAGYSFKSKEWKGASAGGATGTVAATGAVDWKKTDCTGVYDSMAKCYPAFSKKFQ